MEKGVHSGEDKKENPETEAGEAESVGSPKLRRLPAAGAMLLAVLLRFPAETVAPIVSGLSTGVTHCTCFGSCIGTIFSSWYATS